MSLPALLTIDDYFNIVADRLWTIEFIYLVFALVNSGDSHAVSQFVALVEKHPANAWGSKSKIRALLESTAIEPLRLVSAHYGSPASFDLLGIGKILEILRDAAKDLVWRGKHERQMAELEYQNKKVEIEKLRLESDKIITEIAAQKIGVIEKVSRLKLPNEDKRVVIQTLLPSMRMIAPPVPLLLESREPQRTKEKRKAENAA